MIIFPAVDIQKGQAVRLKQGVAHDVTVFADDPVDAALRWVHEGAQWLHVVDLDGAFAGDARSFAVVERICSTVTIPVQLGGGIRSVAIAERYLASGVARLIIGTVALEDPALFQDLCRHFPGKIGVSLDADKGCLKTRGWLGASQARVEDVLPRLIDQGASFLIYTDISRDGMQSGIDAVEIARIVRMASIPVLAAGGIATLSDIQTLFPLHSEGLEGVISGKALYNGTLSLGEANAWIDQQMHGMVRSS